MSIIIEQPDNILVDSYSYFSPSLLDGFARTTSSIYDNERMFRKRNNHTSFSPLSGVEASTLYHNFYGIQGIEASITTTDGYEYTLPKFLDYQTMKTPYSRSIGDIVDDVFVDAIPASITGRLSFGAVLRSVTSDMTAVFSQTPPDDDDDFTGFRGFGMKLLEISGNIQTGIFSSNIQFYFDIATYYYSENDPNLPLAINFEEQQRDYYNQSYVFQGVNYPDLAPTITGKYLKGNHTLTDNNGNSVVFKTNLIISRTQTKYLTFVPYVSDPYIVTGVAARPLPPDPKIVINGSGKFYSYRNNPVQPHNYGI